MTRPTNPPSRSPPLATFANSYRVAAAMSEAQDCDLGVVRTGDPDRPFRVSADKTESATMLVRFTVERDAP